MSTSQTSSPRLVLDAPSPPIDPLASLIERARDGDLLAFEALYRKTREAAYRTLYQLVGPTPDMDDLLQETYLQLLSALRRFRGDARFSTFLYRVCANVGLMYLRAKKRRPEESVAEVPQTQEDPSSNPERSAQAQQAARLMQAALDKLSPKKRVVFVYHELLCMKPEEIAQAVGTSPNTVRSRLHHARKEFTVAVARLKKDAPLSSSAFGGPHGSP